MFLSLLGEEVQISESKTEDKCLAAVAIGGGGGPVPAVLGMRELGLVD